ncbi:MAG: hypothetical protein ACXWWO_06320 [Candidatus Limnocylindria bacterium]
MAETTDTGASRRHPVHVIVRFRARGITRSKIKAKTEDGVVEVP